MRNNYNNCQVVCVMMERKKNDRMASSQSSLRTTPEIEDIRCFICGTLFASTKDAIDHYISDKHFIKLPMDKYHRLSRIGPKKRQFYEESCPSTEDYAASYDSDKRQRVSKLLLDKNPRFPETAASKRCRYSDEYVSELRMDKNPQVSEIASKCCILCNESFRNIRDAMSHYNGYKHLEKLPICDDTNLFQSSRRYTQQPLTRRTSSENVPGELTSNTRVRRRESSSSCCSVDARLRRRDSSSSVCSVDGSSTSPSFTSVGSTSTSFESFRSTSTVSQFQELTQSLSDDDILTVRDPSHSYTKQRKNLIEKEKKMENVFIVLGGPSRFDFKDS